MMRFAYLSAIALAVCVVIALAIVGCRRIEQPPLRRNTVDAAWQDFELGDFAESDVKFEKILSDGAAFNVPDLALEAQYGLACIVGFGSDSNETSARTMFNEIAATAPASPWAAWSRLAMVRLAQQSHGTDAPAVRSQLVESYRSVIHDFPDSAAADEAYVYQQSIRLISLNSDEARLVAADLTRRLDRHESHFTSALYDLRSTAHRLTGQFKESLDDAVASVNAREIDSQNPSPIDASKLYSIGVMAQYDVGDFLTAMLFYQQFLHDFPTDPRSFTVRQLLSEMETTKQSLQKALAKGTP